MFNKSIGHAGVSPPTLDFNLEPLRQGKIEYTKAKAITSLKDEEIRKELMAEAIAKSLSLREIKERINQLVLDYSQLTNALWQ